ncbi:MAG: hypothetical protein KGY74_08770, partial [Candidatus Cloacimonetes bacterium]|nr:hypothetical protein [Candidatus Cloacimonadota bacterium]
VIRDLVNECLEELPLFIIQEVTESASCSGVTLDLDDDIINVKEVYVNDEKVTSALTREEFEEQVYTDNDYCLIGNDRKIYFPASLTASDTIELVVNKADKSLTSLSKSASVSIPSFYTDLLANYVLKEIYLFSDFLDYDKHIAYREKYKRNKLKLRGNPVSAPRLDYGNTL